MPTYSIYKATNRLNGKVYIGIDSHWPARKRGHKHLALKENSGWYFHNALRETGFDNFDWEVIFESEDREYLLREKEPFFIKEYNSYGDGGYNLTPGGDNSPMFNRNHSDDTRQKMAAAKITNPTKYWLGKTRSAETKQKISLNKIGTIQTAEHKKKNSDRIRELWASPEHRLDRLLKKQERKNSHV